MDTMNEISMDTMNEIAGALLEGTGASLEQLATDTDLDIQVRIKIEEFTVLEMPQGTIVGVTPGENTTALLSVGRKPADYAVWARHFGDIAGAAGYALDAYDLAGAVVEADRRYAEEGGLFLEHFAREVGPTASGVAGATLGGTAGATLCTSTGVGILVVGGCAALGSVGGTMAGEFVWDHGLEGMFEYKESDNCAILEFSCVLDELDRAIRNGLRL